MFGFKVKTETTADLNIQHEEKCEAATKEHEKVIEGNWVLTLTFLGIEKNWRDSECSTISGPASLNFIFSIISVLALS